MKICIIGSGASGWMAAHTLKNKDFITEIVVVGSSKIPSIGVGESTTSMFNKFIEESLGLSRDSLEYYKFLRDIDASIKYGVNYVNWSKNKFLHGFLPENTFQLGNKPENLTYNESCVPLNELIYNNKIYTDTTVQYYSYHFDAARFITTLMNLAKKIPKIKFIDDTVTDVGYNNKGVVEYIALESGNKLYSDYFVSCVGQTDFSKKITKEDYISFSDKLLTDKALFVPLSFKNKEKEFHPYTTAKTMKYGWRWITPTYSRIGTGYVFSSNHISIDEACNELLTDIGDSSLEPRVVDFIPRRITKTFKTNICSIGLAAGFLEPLDAPGLSLSQRAITILENILEEIYYPRVNFSHCNFDIPNKIMAENYNYWCNFILHQYKTCHRSDTKFWVDHKNVESKEYDRLINEIFNPEIKDGLYHYFTDDYFMSCVEPWMIHNTSAGKDITWDTKGIKFSIKQDNVLNPNYIFSHHEYFDHIHNDY